MDVVLQFSKIILPELCCSLLEPQSKMTVNLEVFTTRNSGSCHISRISSAQYPHVASGNRTTEHSLGLF